MNNNNSCPIFMMDGRAFTDYRTRSVVNADLMKELNVSDVDVYRQTLQQNAESIMAKQMNASLFKNKCECYDFSNVILNTCNK